MVLRSPIDFVILLDLGLSENQVVQPLGDATSLVDVQIRSLDIFNQDGTLLMELGIQDDRVRNDLVQVGDDRQEILHHGCDGLRLA